MMKDPLDSLEEQVRSRRDLKSPPLHLWHPPLSGDIAIRIDSDGAWYHEGGEIRRESLVRLFASILRREDDGQFYLVTPHEKWRIEVEKHPLMIVDIDNRGTAREPVLLATLNTGREVEVSEGHPLYLDADSGSVAAMRLDHGLTALCTRAAWYRLVEMAVAGKGVLRSGDFALPLPGT